MFAMFGTIEPSKPVLNLLSWPRRSFKLDDCGDGAYRTLLQEYPRVTRVYQSLSSGAQAVIADICKRMGAGMAEFIEKDVVSVDDYDLYCHYVAGTLRALNVEKASAAAKIYATLSLGYLHGGDQAN
jgi:phytoene/squalene synthetase